MKKMILTIMTAVTASILMTGCGSSVPSGSDKEVKKLVCQIARDELRRQLTPAVYSQITKIPVGLIGLKITYEGLKAKYGKDKHAKETIETVDKIIAKTKVSVENIRMNKIDKELKKSYSSADLRIDDNKTPIKYTAQINSDGQLYVEISELNL
jgi:hypothetical protein